MDNQQRNALALSVLPLIRNIVYVYCEKHNCTQSAEDIVGDCNLMLMGWVEKWQPGRGALTSFVGECVKRRCRRFWKKYTPSAVDVRPTSAAPNPLDVVENADDLESLNAALEQLTPDERLIIQYRFYQNLTLKECGKHFGYTPEAARQAEQKALARLKSFIGGI